jgi:AcrR family transcriptional regulator
MPKVVDHAAYRAELLDSAFQLFARVGYGAVTMRGIARELGVSTGTLYHYFATKDDIFEQMVRHVAASAVDDVLAGVKPGSTPLERVEQMLTFVSEHEDYLRNLLFLVIDFHRVNSGDESTRVVRDAIHFFRDAIVSHVGNVQPALATLLLSGLLGTLLQRGLDSENIDFKEQATYLRWVIGGLTS